MLAGNVDQGAFVFQEEMLVITGIGVEITTGRIHDHLAQQARHGEMVKGILDRCL